jgi:hypothetical protein
MRTGTPPKAWRIAIVVGLLGFGGCSSSTAPDTFVPDFTFVWQARSDTSHTFNLFATSNQASGSFSGGSETFKGTTFGNLQGAFNHRAVNFTTDRLVNGSRASFTGSFVDDNTINLQSPEGAITLVRIKL